MSLPSSFARIVSNASAFVGSGAVDPLVSAAASYGPVILHVKPVQSRRLDQSNLESTSAGQRQEAGKMQEDRAHRARVICTTLARADD